MTTQMQKSGTTLVPVPLFCVYLRHTSFCNSMVNAIPIAGGVLYNVHEGCLFIAHSGKRCLFAGVRCSLRGVLRDAAYQAGGVIRVSPRWVRDDERPFNIHDFAHEYGHFLQQQDMGSWRYYTRVAIDSLLHPGSGHYDRHYEADATLRGEQYLAKHWKAR